MRILGITLASAVLLACGGSVSKDELLGGGATGGGGTGGVVSTGGTGAVSGSGGVSGGGTGGVGGEFCCQTDAECNPGVDFWDQRCVEGVCLPIPSSESCWTQADCAPGDSCLGACVCPCGLDCDCGGQLGKCVSPVPEPEPGCCSEDWQCGDLVFAPCVNGVCKQHEPNQCWVDAECAPDQKCVGAFVCPCGADCITEDKPGTCQ
jgi:hypothetical protein